MARAEWRLPNRVRLSKPEQRMPGRTRLLVGLAGLALALLALAAVGIGRQVSRGNVIDSAATLPQLSVEPAKRPGPLSAYAVIGQTPLFYADRQPHPFVIANAAGDGQPAEATFDFMLTGIVLSPTVQLVTLQPKDGRPAVRVQKGEAPTGAEGWILQSVEPRAAVFVGPGGENRLELRTYTGDGGRAPMMPGGMPPPGIAQPPPLPQVTNVEQAAAAARNAAMAASQPPPTPPAQDVVPSDAQIQAIRARIQARRAELARQRSADQNKNP